MDKKNKVVITKYKQLQFNFSTEKSCTLLSSNHRISGKEINTRIIDISTGLIDNNKKDELQIINKILEKYKN